MSDRSEAVSSAIRAALPEPPAELQAQAGPLMLQTVTLQTLVDRVNLIKAAMRQWMGESCKSVTCCG